jgi:hypothetical protein
MDFWNRRNKKCRNHGRVYTFQSLWNDVVVTFRCTWLAYCLIPRWYSSREEWVRLSPIKNPSITSIFIRIKYTKDTWQDKKKKFKSIATDIIFSQQY